MNEEIKTPLETTMLPVPASEGSKAMAEFKSSTLLVETCLDRANPVHNDLICKATLEDGLKLPEATAEPFYLWAWVAYIRPYLDQETGEMQPRVCCVLIDPNGRMLSWITPVTTTYFGRIMAAKGKGPYDPPIPLRVVPHKGSKAGSWYSLTLDTKAPAWLFDKAAKKPAK